MTQKLAYTALTDGVHGGRRGVEVTETDRLPVKEPNSDKLVLDTQNIVDGLADITIQMKILNARFEEAFRTRTSIVDIENEN